MRIAATCSSPPTGTPTASSIDPPLAGRGHAEISALTDVVLTHYAGHRFERTTDVDMHHTFARYGWNLVGPDGTVAVSGTDFVELDDDGKLLRESSASSARSPIADVPGPSSVSRILRSCRRIGDTPRWCECRRAGRPVTR